MSAELLARMGRRADALAEATAGLALVDEVAAGDDASSEERLRATRCRYQVARARHILGDVAGAGELLEVVLPDLRRRVATRPSEIAPYIGFGEALAEQARLEPSDRCQLAQEALDAWRSWPGAPTAYTRRHDAALASAIDGCRRP
jgi:hypothetical protein